MNLEILVATMNRKDISFAENMNLQTDALIINQTTEPMEEIRGKAGAGNVRMISCCERGLSRSRNRALENAKGDICFIVDEDIHFTDDSKEQIVSAHEKYPDYDVIAFVLDRNSPGREKKHYAEPKKVGYLRSMKILSCEITFKRRPIIENGIRFNENFGTGSGKYASGEENIFLYNCLKKGLKILYLPICVAAVTGQQSSWFSAWDRKLFYDKGALFYEMSHTFWLPLILQFAVHKYPRYRKNLSFFAALKAMADGKRDYCKSLKAAK